MQRIAGPGAIDGLFVEEDTGTGQPPTQITAAWMNAVQEEICAVIAAATITLDGSSHVQLLAAITALISTAGSGGRLVPVGGIIEWSGAIADIPLHWALCDGSNGTPDLRNRFVIGSGHEWFEGCPPYFRGDTGGSADAVVVTHSHGINETPHSHGYAHVGDDSGADEVDTADASSLRAPRNAPATTDSTATGITIQDAGESGAGKNMPPFYALAYIKLIS